MKVLYIEAKKKKSEKLNEESLKTLPKELFIAYSIQFKSLAEQIQAHLIKHSYNIIGFQQVLGCTKLRVKNNAAILLIGSGRFHALNLALQNKEVYIYNNGLITKIAEKDINDLKKNKETNLRRFFLARKIGILVSTKPGQENTIKAQLLKERILKKYPEKEVFLFFSSHINVNEFENFQIDFWINSACPGLINDASNLLNIDDILENL